MMMSMSSERGKLYLGREYDLKKSQVGENPVFYKAQHLTTHGVILGMTGSGKTGLGVILLEEVLLQGLPVLILDPKGDIANLLLTFPDLRPEDFGPWVDVEGAQRKGVSVEEYAAQEAAKWQKGLADWGVTGERIAQLRRAAQFTIFTPGSEAGQPVNVLHFFEAPELDWDEHEEALRERVGGIVSALLGLVGVEADPLQSPEHILLARIVEHVWRAGEHLDLPTLIHLLQKPPFNQVGVFDLEAFFPEKDRFALARTLNNLVAAPGFESWQEGMPLDVKTLLFAEDGRPRASIFYMAHLDDAQRLFFITLFLEAVRDWVRQQSGTTDLRALLYFDEVFGFFPPYPRNPSTKTPLMALIKQGRSAGLGVVLATQNPGDLDYKGLTNAGTWAVGSLRAERDKERVLEGLEGAVAEAGAAMDRRTLDAALGALKPRVFLLHDIREGAPVFFHTRWAMSYLAGPLTRKQVRELAGPAAEAATSPSEARTPAASKQTVVVSVAEPRPPEAVPEGLSPTPPTLPPEILQAFLPPTTTFEWALRAYEEQTKQAALTKDRDLVYVPRLLALGAARLLDRKRGVDHQKNVVRLIQVSGSSVGVNWGEGEAVVGNDDLALKPMGEGLYEPLPAELARSRDLAQLAKDFADYLYYNASVTILYNPALDLYGDVGENRRDFRVRCGEEAERQRDAELKKARAAMDKKIDAVEKQMRREERELKADEAELAARKRDEVLGIGESAFNLLSGRRASTALSRASRKRTMTQKAKSDVEESLEAIEDLEGQLQALEEEWQDQAADIKDAWADRLEEIEEFELKPRRTDVTVSFCGLAWVPVWRVVLEDGRQVDLPARE
ncbi:MAG: DUF853 family protein [Anaerolineae bacterium]|nr:DUF853 family protein [Anaerolineae bacterium]